MTPTNKLRFVEREEIDHGNSSDEWIATRPVRILQQWWEDRRVVIAVYITDKDGNPVPSPTLGEWRDVTVEEENG
jgi:hypothetical protein